MRVSIRDGKLKSADLYVTNDVAFAAYLMSRGYELLGTYDEGIKSPYGKSIMFFGLMAPEGLTVDLPISISRYTAVQRDVNDKWDEFENRYWISPLDPNDKVNVKDFVKHYRACFRALDEAIRK